MLVVIEGQVPIGTLALLLFLLLSFRFSIFSTLFVDNACGYLRGTVSVPAALLKLMLEFVVLTFPFRTGSTRHVLLSFMSSSL
jgi:hypothetical protein